MSTEVRIGIRNVAREVAIEATHDAEEVRSRVQSALDGGVLELTDEKGRTVLVPGEALGFVEVGPAEKPRVGFGER